MIQGGLTDSELAKRYDGMSAQFRRLRNGQVPTFAWLKRFEADVPGVSRFRHWGLLEASHAAWRFSMDRRRSRYRERLRGLLIAPDDLNEWGWSVKQFDRFAWRLQSSDLFEQGNLLATVLMSRLSRYSPWAQCVSRHELREELYLFHMAFGHLLRHPDLSDLRIREVVEEVHLFPEEYLSNPHMMWLVMDCLKRRQARRNITTTETPGRQPIA